MPLFSDNVITVRSEKRMFGRDQEFAYLLIISLMVFANIGGPRAEKVSLVTMDAFPQHGQTFGSKGLIFIISIKPISFSANCSRRQGMIVFFDDALKIP